MNYADYYNWLVNLIDDGRADDYKDLIFNLFMCEFYWSINNDGNRESDGLELRERFCDEEIPFDMEDPIQVGPRYCSVLEVIIALAIRMENILYDPDYGDRTSEWFWIMIDNLGLSYMDDNNFDAFKFDEIIDIFLNRTYEIDGKGSLFYVKNFEINMKKTEIWYQMMYFINENYEEN